MQKLHLVHPAPSTEKLTVAINPGGRKTNAAYRSREYLTPAEVEALMKVARGNRHGHRDATMILIAFRHGLRVTELCNLRWDQVHFDDAVIHVKRLKNGKRTCQPLQGDELRALRRLKREQAASDFIFSTERGGPFTSAGFQALVRRAGVATGFAFTCHPHMLRHACGYALANKGIDTRTLQEYMGHANIQNTVVYTEMAPNRFKGLWD